MNPYKGNIFNFLAVLTVSITLAGCVSYHTLKSTDIPQLQTGSPLKSVSPKTFAFKEFRDTRGGNAYLVESSGTKRFLLDRPVATVVAEAIRQELERNGHKCIEYSSQSTADFIIEGSVYKYSTGVQRAGGAGFRGESFGNVAVKLTVSTISLEKILTKNYEGKYHVVFYTPWWPKRLDILSEAQSAMLKEMSNDTELIEFIRK